MTVPRRADATGAPGPPAPRVSGATSVLVVLAAGLVLVGGAASVVCGLAVMSGDAGAAAGGGALGLLVALPVLALGIALGVAARLVVVAGCGSREDGGSP